MDPYDRLIALVFANINIDSNLVCIVYAWGTDDWNNVGTGIEKCRYRDRTMLVQR